MNKELFIVVIPVLSGFLFSLGGTEITEKIKGQKWIRRFVLPFAIMFPSSLIIFSWWQSLIVAIIACIVFHLGYGDRASWIKKFFIFAGYGLISLPIGLSWWNLFTAAGCFILMLLSQKVMPKTFTWKICELSFGVLIGIQVSYILAK